MKLYLIGPMSGIRSFNYPAFLAAAEYLRGEGFDVHSPTANDSKEVFDLAMASPDGDITALQLITGLSNEDFVARSIAVILTWKPDALVGLEGWEESTGAVNEYLVGKSFAIPTYHIQDYDPIVGFPTPETAPELYDADGKFISHADNPLRQRTVTGGVKDNRGKLPLDLIPYEALKGAADVLAYGAIKYKPNNWRLGLKWSETWSSLQRHLWAWKEGEDLDPETGKPHIDHAMCQMLFLATYVHDPAAKQFDDRWSSSDREAAKA